MEELENKYIELLLKQCLNFERSKSLMIHIDLKEHLDFAKKVEQQANDYGIMDVVIHINDLDEIHEYLKNTTFEDIKINKLIDRSIWDEYAKKGAALLFLTSEVPELMNDIESTKIQKWITERGKITPYYRENVTKNTFPWTIAALPNERWAKQLFPNDAESYNKLYKYIFNICMIDKEDPVKEWETYIIENNKYKDTLNSLEITTLHYTNSLGTDLYVEKPKDNIWINLDKNDFYGNKMIANMPSYEIFTTPDCNKTNGIVYSSNPLFYNGTCIDNFYIKFQNGRAIECAAEKGEEVLKTLLFKNEGADYLGEIALVPYDSPISNIGIVFNTTLFDENASCHLALGDGYIAAIPKYEDKTNEELRTLGLNNSQVHVDFMIGTKDLKIEAETNKGNILIFENGNFVI